MLRLSAVADAVSVEAFGEGHLLVGRGAARVADLSVLDVTELRGSNWLLLICCCMGSVQRADLSLPVGHRVAAADADRSGLTLGGDCN